MNTENSGATLAEITAHIQQRNDQARANGIPALHRLIGIAEGDHGQAHHVRRFLLGLYNSEQWPFELNRLRVLDPGIQADALSVIALDWCGSEVHKYLDNGDDRFSAYWERETTG